jgi:hypothetical protein
MTIELIGHVGVEGANLAGNEQMVAIRQCSLVD